MVNNIKSTSHIKQDISHNNEDISHNSYSSGAMGLARIAKVIRPLAYSSEFGEAFRHRIPMLVKPLYGLSFGYVMFDTYTQTHNIQGNSKKKLTKIGDTLLWHGFASLLFPGIIVHSTVKYSERIMKHMSFSPKYIHKLPPIVGLMSIFLVVHSVDHYTDVLLDSTTRKLYALPSK